jgi:hypothetical protein
MSSSNYDYQVVTYGQGIVIRGTFTDAFGSGFEPGTVHLWVTTPDGTQFRYDKLQHGTVVKEWDNTGSIWYAVFAANQEGYWRWKFEGTSDGQPVNQAHNPNHGAFNGRVFVRYSQREGYDSDETVGP